MMEGETSDEIRIRSDDGRWNFWLNKYINEENDMNYLSSLVESTSEENITNSVARNVKWRSKQYINWGRNRYENHQHNLLDLIIQHQ